MKEYIINLTDNYIGKHGLLAAWDIASSPGKDVLQRKRNFKAYVMNLLLTTEVMKMSPEKIGEIQCAIEQPERGFKCLEEVLETIPNLSYGSPDIIARFFVAHYLAVSISFRLWPESIPLSCAGRVPPYRMRAYELLFICFQCPKEEKKVAVFLNGEGKCLLFRKEECSVMLQSFGDPIWRELVDNWPTS